LRGELQSPATFARVARLVVRGVDATDDPVGRVAHRRLDRDALLGRLHLGRAPVTAHPLGLSGGPLECLVVRVEREDAARELVVLEAGVAPELAQEPAAVEREREELPRVLAVAERQAFEEEPRAPRPLTPLRARPEDERRVVAAEPLQELRRHARVGPRLGVARRDLPTVREARLEARGALPLDHGDFVPGARQVPGARRAYDARAEHDHPHAPPLAIVMNKSVHAVACGCSLE
jgi:hypothetical protein